MTNKTKIKVLIFIPDMECGGMEKYTALLCNNIDTAVFDITLAILNNANPFFIINNKAVKVIDLHEPHIRFSWLKIFRTIRKSKPDIVFTTGNDLNLYISIFRRFISKKIIVIGRETSIVSINNQKAKLPALYDLLVKKFYSNLDLVISQSAYMEKDLIANYNISPQKSVVIYNPVENISNRQQQVNMEKDDIHKFITVARLAEVKGIERLIASVSLLQIPFVYYIIGEGSMRNELQQQINKLKLQDKIFLLGRKAQPFAEMDNATLFLMGSHYEGLGNVLLEAGARGIPVVAFDAPGGIGEVIREGENGLLVKNNDEKAFAAAVEKALQTPFDRNKIIENTKKRFSINTIIAEIEKLFIQLTGPVN